MAVPFPDRVELYIGHNKFQISMCWAGVGGAAILWCSSIKNLPYNAGNTGLTPAPARSHMLRSN